MTSVTVFVMFLLFSESHSFVLRQNRQAISPTGNSQSPILANLSETKYVEYPSFLFSIGDREFTAFRAFNRNGETISIMPILTNSKPLIVSGGCLTDFFTFQNADLHWSKSEHRFSKVNYIAEAYFIHKNLDTNETAAFAYFFKLADSQSQENNDETNGWDYVIQKFANNTNITIASGLSSLMKEKHDRFIHYMGSFTTEPLTEDAIWILVSSNMHVKDTSSNHFRKNIITSNYRVMQSINARTVRRSFFSTSWNNS
ncbi:unnamed protein product [Rotaria socialis]|uniref:carbonic anhydrase n=1 Tax=Rotaria socialis TaxID=392032 RepID=A0A821A5E3_9BILA|nr:unnamed protein product [Rotaria socialis]CAF4575819.1 unnamed protein product [Rotaria socialis]